MEEQLKRVHEVIDVVDCPNRRTCVTLLRYKLDNPKTSFAQVRLFGRKKEEEKFLHIVYVNYRLGEFLYLLDAMNSLYDKGIANQPNCKILYKVLTTIYSNHLFFLFESVRMSWNIGDNRNLFLKLKPKLACIMLNLKIKFLLKKLRLLW